MYFGISLAFTRMCPLPLFMQCKLPYDVDMTLLAIPASQYAYMLVTTPTSTKQVFF